MSRRLRNTRWGETPHEKYQRQEWQRPKPLLGPPPMLQYWYHQQYSCGGRGQVNAGANAAASSTPSTSAEDSAAQPPPPGTDVPAETTNTSGMSNGAPGSRRENNARDTDNYFKQFRPEEPEKAAYRSLVSLAYGGYTRSLPFRGTRWRGPAAGFSSYAPRLSSRRGSSRGWPGRGASTNGRNHVRFSDAHEEFEEDMVILDGAEWINPNEVHEEEQSSKKAESSVLGPEERMRETVKEKAEWLKNKMKNKDHSLFGDLLKEKSRQKTTEEQPTKPAERAAVNLLNSALEADSLEEVQKNIADNQKSSPTFAPESKKEETAKIRTGCDTSAVRRAPILGTSAMKATADPPKRATVKKASPSFPKPNLSSRRTERTTSSSSASHEKIRGPEKIPSTSTKRDDVMNYLKKVCGVSNIGQVKDLLVNPRPGKFEYKLRELINHYRKSSQREARLSEPFAGADHIKTERSCSDDDFIASLSDLTDCAVDVSDLPAGFVQELGDMLGFDFLGASVSVDEAAEDEAVPIFSPQESAVTPDQKNPVHQFECNATQTGIWIKDFARIQGTTTRTPPAAPRSQNEGQNPRSQNEGQNPRSQNEGQNPPSRKTGEPEQEADTTIRAAHPLDGPNLMAVVAATAISQDTSSDVRNVAQLPPSTPTTQRPNSMEPGVFFRAENSGKKSGSARSKGTKTAAARSPDSTMFYDSEQSLESVGQSRSKRKSATRVKKTTFADVVDISSDERTRGPQELEEHEVLARLQEVCKEISELTGRLKKLEAERADLYTLLPVGKSLTDAGKRRRDPYSSDTDEGEINEILERQRAAISQIGSPPSDPTNYDTGNRAVKRKKAKLKRSDFSSKPRTPLGTPPEAKASKNTPEKGSLAFLTGSVVFSGRKENLPNDLGVITQIKMTKKWIVASSVDGNVYSITSLNGKIRRKFQGQFPVKCFVLAETSKPEVRLFSGSEDGHLHCFQFLTGEQIHRPVKVSSEITCLDSKWGNVYIGTKSGCIMRYDIEKTKLNSDPISIHSGVVLGVACTMEGARKVLIVGAAKGEVELICANTGLLLRRVTVGWDADTYKYAVDVNLNRVFCCKSVEISVFDYSTGQNTGARYKILSQVSCMCLHNKILYVGCKNGVIKRYDAQTNRQLEPLAGNRENVVCMDVIDGKIILARKGGVFDVVDINDTPSTCNEKLRGLDFTLNL